ncbi:MAG TPA: radical SAM protein [Acidimicrobiia bacterium]|nr:radical SAM protein [Acidimicrobiia bacterium]
MKVLLVSTYELGHQPLGVAHPAGALAARGHDVRALDLAVEPWDPAVAGWADRVAFSVPMHTAARLARDLAGRIDGPVACYGLYAAMCSDVATALDDRDARTALVRWVEDDPGAVVAPALPARDLLPGLNEYAGLVIDGTTRLAGATEASAGCVHRCRHCPVPVVFDGRIRITAVDAVLADVAQQVDQGARHITFVDPDFLNGPHHARRVARAFHAAFPDITFDCTVKVEHVLAHADAWAELADAGCLFVVSAFESVNDTILDRLDKHHTAADASRAVEVLRAQGIEVRPSWLPFTPWSTVDDICDIVEFVAAHDLVPNVDPVQYSIRLLLPRGSLLLGHLDPLAWDPERLSYRWTSPLDPLQHRIAELVERGGDYAAVRECLGLAPVPRSEAERPHLSEPWFCCAEPTGAQLALADPDR